MDNNILDDEYECNRNQKYFRLSRNAFVLFLCCLLVIIISLMKSDGHPLLNDIYQDIAGYFFIGLLISSVTSIFFIMISLKNNEDRSVIRTVVLILNSIIFIIYFFLISIISYDYLYR